MMVSIVLLPLLPSLFRTSFAGAWVGRVPGAGKIGPRTTFIPPLPEMAEDFRRERKLSWIDDYRN